MLKIKNSISNFKIVEQLFKYIIRESLGIRDNILYIAHSNDDEYLRKDDIFRSLGLNEDGERFRTTLYKDLGVRYFAEQWGDEDGMIMVTLVDGDDGIEIRSI